MMRARRVSSVLLPLFLLVACADRDGPRVFEPDAEAVAANNRGVGLMGTFDYEAAQAVFASLVEAYPDWLDARVNLAIATLNRQFQGDEQATLALLEEVLAAEPADLRANYMVGLLRLFRGESALAERHFRSVAEADPKDAYPAYFLGQSLAQQRRTEDALAAYVAAMEADPLLRSALFAASRELMQLGRGEEAERFLGEYERLEHNPHARLAEFKYTRMGPKAMAITVNAPLVQRRPRPAGPLFAPPAQIAVVGIDAGAWKTPTAQRTPSITAADLQGDGRLDLFVADALTGEAPNAVLLGGEEGGFTADPGHPLASVRGVNAALWGDFDNDALIDAYLLRGGANQLWRQSRAGVWDDVTAAAGAAGGRFDTVDGAFFDADHDGDLDLFLVNADGPNELLNNNLDGTFRALAAERGISGGARASRAVLAADLDGDRDADLVILHAAPPHEIYWNDRLWQYRAARGFDAVRSAPLVAALAADLDADGAPELYTQGEAGELARWQADADGVWRATPLAPGAGREASGSRQLALADVAGDGRVALLHSTGALWTASAPDEAGVATLYAAQGSGPLASWAPVLLDPNRGPAVVGLHAAGGLSLWSPGPGRWPFVAVAFSGREDPAESIRSNASGIGTRAAFRVGSRWTVTDTYRPSSGPGQSLQPVAVGVGDDARVDFVAIDWSDGVSQSELDLEPGPVHRVAETQRQLSSCPLLFAWNGTGYTFVSDLLGVGGIGMFVEPGRYGRSRPWENFLLPEGLLEPADGRYRLKVAQMMEEIVYLDAVRLVAYDLPPGWQLALDERMATAPPDPSGDALFYRRELPVARALNERGEDVTRTLARADLAAAPPGPLDSRFIGLLDGEHAVALRFAEPVDRGPGDPVLVVDGWLEYPYAQTVFAAWQAGRRYRPLTLEARAPDGPWQVVFEEFGYPAGMPRNMSVPLVGLPAGATELRLRTNQEIYLDRIAVVYAEALEGVVRRSLPLVTAEVRQPGFARRSTRAQRLPGYEYGERRPFWDTRHPRGWYTRSGPAHELVEVVDDAIAICGPGEEIHLEFAALDGDLPPGWTRRLVLEANGWSKDMDLYTRDGGTVGPLPSNGHPADARERLHALYNTRYEAGR